MNRRGWIVFIGANTLWFIALLVLLFLLVDRSVSYTYLDASYHSATEENAQLRKIAETALLGRSRSDVEAIINKSVKVSEDQPVIKRESDQIWVDSLCFSFNDGVFSGFSCQHESD